MYEPECDYIDGVLEGRNAGEKEHSKVQAKLIRMLPLSLSVFPEVRIRVSATKYRVPDVAVYTVEPAEQVFTTAPNLVIEILSPEDRWTRMTQKLEDYRSMGTAHIWIIDPWRKKAYRFTGSQVVEEPERLIAEDLEVTVALGDLW